MAKRARRGCYRCGSKCYVKGCRVCRGKVLCNQCAPEAYKRDDGTH